MTRRDYRESPRLCYMRPVGSIFAMRDFEHEGRVIAAKRQVEAQRFEESFYVTDSKLGDEQ